MSFVYCLEHNENPNWVTLLTLSNKEGLDERQPGNRKPSVMFEPPSYIAKVQVKNANKIKDLISTVMQPLSIICENDTNGNDQEVFSKNIRIIHAAFMLANRNTCVFSEVQRSGGVLEGEMNENNRKTTSCPSKPFTPSLVKGILLLVHSAALTAYLFYHVASVRVWATDGPR